jgi:hypothetical protein
MMSSDDGADGFIDYLFGSRFSLANTQIWGKPTAVLYLHGALHLYRLLDGETRKARWEPGAALLGQFAGSTKADAIPLFVAEGDPASKMAAIRNSDYLSFAYRQFSQNTKPLVIFGHSLGDSDTHLVHAIQSSVCQDVAISIMPAVSEVVKARKHELHRQFQGIRLRFFDATTHPLGDPSLAIPHVEGDGA